MALDKMLVAPRNLQRATSALSTSAAGLFDFHFANNRPKLIHLPT
jgi:hypothetical protein